MWQEMGTQDDRWWPALAHSDSCWVDYPCVYLQKLRRGSPEVTQPSLNGRGRSRVGEFSGYVLGQITVA